MSTPEQRLAHVEAMLRALLDTVNPIMGFQEVQALLKYKSRVSVRAWLKEHKIERRDRGFRRVEVIAAATQEKK